MDSKNDKIDFVVFWVDSNDQKWRKEKEKWEESLNVTPKRGTDISERRYHDYGLLKYWFRGIEQFTPWVNKIHFVTYGHLPEWLNTKHPKLHIVNHSDYLPKEVLPTFNSNVIETSVHKIDGLSEQFVLFNDDVFIINKVKPSYFFKHGKPVNMMSLHPIFATNKTPHYRTLINNMEIINKNFDFRKSFHTNKNKYLSLRQGKYLLRTIPLLGYNEFPGFANYHGPASYLKSTCEAVWKAEPSALEKTMQNRFRNYDNDVSDWVFNYWQFATGNYYQKTYRHEKNISMDNPKVFNIIKDQKYDIIGLSDPKNIDSSEKTIKQIQQSFNIILPAKSSFEKGDTF